MNFLEEIDIGKNIKKIRSQKGYTQIELGELINKSESTIRKYESGAVKINMDILNKIANVLKEPVGKFLETEPITENDLLHWDLSFYKTEDLIKELNSRDDFPIKLNLK